ncbi:MAG: DNA repair protein RecN (Recombination protein N) [Limisphaerales bacterium]
MAPSKAAMLVTLRIKNLALVSDLTLELRPGFNAVTGETGAGKSIIIGALNLVLGERADRNLIRSGADSCSVEAVIDLTKTASPIDDFLDENGLEPCEEGQLLLKRTFTAAGSNRQFINGSPTTLSVLGTLGEWLVDMHGPHDHQSLLHTSRQLLILDAYGNLDSLRKEFAGLARQRTELEENKAALIVDEQTYAQQLDLLRFQCFEIEGAELRAEEEEELEQEHRRASNAARLLELCQGALQALDDDDQSLMTQAGAVGRALQELTGIDAKTEPLLEAHGQAVEILGDLQRELSSYADGVDVDPRRLRELEERVDLIHSLKRKYGVTVEGVIAFGSEARAKLQSLEQRDEELARLNAALAKLDEQIAQAGKKLTAGRRKVIPKLEKAVVTELNDLGFAQSHFAVALETAAPPTGKGGSVFTTGFDSIEFQFAPNPGEPSRSLRAIASSGEMARVMLALKTVLAAQDEVPILIFDEVDANVGGETANVVGEKMRKIGENRQTLCITHLAPVAAAADAHYVVSKRVEDGRTFSDIVLLDKASRVDELARMLGGKGDAAKRHAKELLKS